MSAVIEGLFKDLPRTLTVKQVAELAGKDGVSIRRWLQKKVLPAVQAETGPGSSFGMRSRTSSWSGRTKRRRQVRLSPAVSRRRPLTGGLGRRGLRR